MAKRRKNKPPDQAKLVAKADQLFRAGQRQEAVDLLSGPAADPSASDQVLISLAHMLMGMGQYAHAGDLFARLARRRPEDASLLNSRAMALAMTGDLLSARLIMDKALEMEPDKPAFLKNLAKLYLMEERWDQAEPWLIHAWRVSPPAERSGLLDLLNQARMQGGRAMLTETEMAELAAAAEAAPATPPPSLATSGPRIVSAAPPAPAASPRPRVLFCCAPQMDNFLADLARDLGDDYDTEKVVSLDINEHRRAIERHDTVWLEWGNELSQAIIAQNRDLLASRRVILRVHAYEAVTGLADQIDYTVVNDLMFVCRWMRDLLLDRRPEIARQVERVHVIPNGVDLARFPLTPRQPGGNIAYVGYLNFKKAPMVLMHAIRAVSARDRRFQLHVAGTFQDPYHEQAVRGFVENNDLTYSVSLHGWVADMPAFLAQMHYIICTSLSESQGMGLMEAMATGMQPLIYNFPGAEGIYPRRFLWNDLEELWACLHRRHDPAETRRFVEENYSLERQVAGLKLMLKDKQAVVFEGPVFQAATRPPVPAGCFADRAAERLETNRQFAAQLLKQGFHSEAMVFLERAWQQSRHQDREVATALTALLRQRADWPAINRLHLERGLSAARRGDLEDMLLSFFEFYYYAYRETASYRWQRFEPAIDATLAMLGPGIESEPCCEELIAGLDPAKLKLVILAENLEPRWSAAKRLISIGKLIDKSRFEVIYFCRLPPSQGWQAVADDLTAAGCRLAWTEAGNLAMPAVRRAIHLLRGARADFTLVNTSFLTPWIDLVSHSGAAGRVVKFISQAGGLESGVDLALNSVLPLALDEAVDTLYVGPAYVIDPPAKRKACRRQGRGLKVIAVGRKIMFLSERFWRVVLEALNRDPELTVTVLGVEPSDIFGQQGPPTPRLRLLGFRDDVLEQMAQADVLLDTWPLGGGSTLREAHALGLPVISLRADETYYEPYTTWSETHVGLNEFVHPELLLKEFTVEAVGALLGRLAREKGYYERICREAQQIPVYTSREFAERFQQAMLAMAGRAPARS